MSEPLRRRLERLELRYRDYEVGTHEEAIARALDTSSRPRAAVSLLMVFDLHGAR